MPGKYSYVVVLPFFLRPPRSVSLPDKFYCFKEIHSNLELIQCVVAALGSLLLAFYFNMYKKHSKLAVPLTLAIGVTYTLGFVLTNMAFSQVSH